MSGSEYMAINLAKEFCKYGYRVFIFGSFIDDSNNYEGIHNKIEYIDNKYFSEFALKYIIDYLIISRYTCNLIYYDNIKNVYLWVHDVLPIMNNNSNSKNFQTHKDKFRKIITVSNWQKNNIQKQLNIPDEYFFSSRNAIYTERFLHNDIPKIPFRFIYSSCPSRGLQQLINIIPLIKEKYPETTLQLFVNKNLIDPDTLKKINALHYVFLNKRVSQDQLAIEFLKSDIWFYPTNFEETFCITALEAMMAKCLIVTVDLAGLSETVKGRGIVCNHPIEDNIDDLLEKFYFVIQKPSLKQHFIDKSFTWAHEQTYEKLAKDWILNIF
jgi:glycosyltransferase involved in cell wall biosynthesis